MARDYEDKPVLNAFISALIFAALLGLFLFLQHLFNDELAVLYQETGKLTLLKPSFVACVAYIIVFLLLTILLYAGLIDDMNDALMAAIVIFAVALFIIAIWSNCVSIYGFYHSPNIKVKFLLAAPVSTLISVPILLICLSILSIIYQDEPKAFPYILFFPLISLIIGYTATFALSFIPNYQIFLNVYCILSPALFVGSAIFLCLSHPVGDLVGFTIDFASNYHSYSSGGGSYSSSHSSGTSSSSSSATIPDYVLDDIARNIKLEARPMLSKASIERVSVDQSGSTLNIIVHISFSFDSSYSEYDVNRIVESEGDEISGRASSIARDRLGYHEIYYISNIEAESSADYTYYK